MPRNSALCLYHRRRGRRRRHRLLLCIEHAVLLPAVLKMYAPLLVCVCVCVCVLTARVGVCLVVVCARVSE